MIEYTSEMFNTNCNLENLKIIVHNVLRGNVLSEKVLQNFKEGKKNCI